MSVTLRYAVGLAAALVVALAVTGLANAQQPTLQFDRHCYTEDQEMRFTGQGYTPGGEVNLFLARPSDPRAMFITEADNSGSLDDYVTAGDEDDVLNVDEVRETLFVSAIDRTRHDAGQQPPESQFGVAQFVFTRWAGYSPTRLVAGKRIHVVAFGWAFATGETVWFQLRKGSRLVATVKVGRLDAVYGDREATIRVPRKLKPGKYRLVLSTKRRGLSSHYTFASARVRAGEPTRAIKSSRSQAMTKVKPQPAPIAPPSWRLGETAR